MRQIRSGLICFNLPCRQGIFSRFIEAVISYQVNSSTRGQHKPGLTPFQINEFTSLPGNAPKTSAKPAPVVTDYDFNLGAYSYKRK